MNSETHMYNTLLADIKARVRQAQHAAILSANAEMIQMYWDIGMMIAVRQAQDGWGSGVIPRLSIDLKNELPEQKGFSERNLGYMIRFAREYGDPAFLQHLAAKSQSGKKTQGLAILQQPAAKLQPQLRQGVTSEILLALPWFHHIVLIQKIEDLSVRFWYARQAIEQGWSREVLTVHIKNRAHERQGAAVTNFAVTLPTVHGSLASGLLKDPFLFDFFTMEEPYHERELETKLIGHIQKFLVELGQGFAFVGRQYQLEVNGRDFYIDLLFYHLRLRCFVVVDLKKGEFKPEHAGKMNFYCSVVDDQLRHPQDQPTLGLILCQTKDRILAEYSLRDIHKPIGIADYELANALPTEFASNLPSIETIEAELSRDLEPDKGE